MKLATLKQAKKILELAEDLPVEHLQNLLESGLLSILFNANVDDMMERMTLNDFRKLCGLVSVFTVWKIIKLGTGLKSADDFRKSIKKNAMKISDWASDILGKPAFTTAAKETELDLVKVTVAELGFKNGARRDQIYDRAKEFGLEICPSEVGPQLRLQYKDQPNNEWILIAMEPITDSDNELTVLDVECPDSELYLSRNYGNPESFWDFDVQWVFVLPRNK